MSAEKHGASDRGWDLRLGGAIVQTYDTREDAEGAMAWYLKTYGAPASALYVEAHDAD